MNVIEEWKQAVGRCERNKVNLVRKRVLYTTVVTICTYTHAG